MNIFIWLPQCNYVVLQVVLVEDEQICLEGLEVEHTDQQYYNIDLDSDLVWRIIINDY